MFNLGIDIGGSSVKLAYFAGSTLKKAIPPPGCIPTMPPAGTGIWSIPGSVLKTPASAVIFIRSGLFESMYPMSQPTTNFLRFTKKGFPEKNCFSLKSPCRRPS